MVKSDVITSCMGNKYSHLKLWISEAELTPKIFALTKLYEIRFAMASSLLYLHAALQNLKICQPPNPYVCLYGLALGPLDSDPCNFASIDGISRELKKYPKANKESFLMMILLSLHNLQ